MVHIYQPSSLVTYFFYTLYKPRSTVLILQLFLYFTYVTAHSPTLLSLLLRHRLFTYVTWRTAHGYKAWRLVDRYHVIIFC